MTKCGYSCAMHRTDGSFGRRLFNSIIFNFKKMWVIKLFEGLPKFMRVSREGLALLECQFLRVWFEGLV